MNPESFLSTAIEASQAAGGFLRANFGRPLTVDENLAHDTKLELDKRTQALIEEVILSRYPEHAIYGEEGLRGDQQSEVSMDHRPDRRHRELLLLDPPFCRIDRPAPQRQNHCRRHLRPDAQ